MEGEEYGGYISLIFEQGCSSGDVGAVCDEIASMRGAERAYQPLVGSGDRDLERIGLVLVAEKYDRVLILEEIRERYGTCLEWSEISPRVKE